MPLKIGESAEALVGIDAEGLIVYWNDAATRLLGYCASEVLAKPCHEVFHGLRPGGTLLCGDECVIRARCARCEAPQRFEMVVPHPSGGEVWLDVATAIVLDEGDRPLSLHILTESVTAKRLTDIAESVVRRIAATPVHPAPAYDLTHREADVLRLLVDGLTTEQMATRLTLAPATVRNHIQSVLSKLGAHSRAEAVVRAIRANLVDLH